MKPDTNHCTPAGAFVPPAGLASNGGTQRYLLEAESTTGFIAFKTADGTILVSAATETSLPASPSISFWSCADYQDTTPAGQITFFDCHGNGLAFLDVRALAGLEYLDASFNRLTQIPLDGLTELQGLDVDNNQLADLQVRHLHALRVLNCAKNRLKALDVSGLDLLQILDCANNPLVSMKHEGCTALQEGDNRTDAALAQGKAMLPTKKSGDGRQGGGGGEPR